MDQKDNKFQNQETRTSSQGQDRNIHKGHDKSQQPVGISFIVRKAEKLTTALYMVTDIMSEKEPMKWKAREAGVELLSDIMVTHASGSSERMTILRNAAKKIEQIISFLDVAQSTRMMSEMNASVLKKEYVALKDACLIEWQRTSDGSKNIFTESFFEVPHQIEQDGLRSDLSSDDQDGQDGLRVALGSERATLEEVGRLGAQPSEAARLPVVSQKIPEQKISQGQQVDRHERVLEQKQRGDRDGLRSDLSSGRSYLEEAGRPIVTQEINQGHHLEETVRLNVPETKNISSVASRSEEAARPHTQPLAPKVVSPTRPAFTPRATISPTGIIERSHQDVGRDDRRKIILALIKQKPALTVKDIARSIPGVSEKTIQRELFAMVADGILTKKGDRRWSTYSLPV